MLSTLWPTRLRVQLDGHLYNKALYSQTDLV